jgi:hypothetical protein
MTRTNLNLSIFFVIPLFSLLFLNPIFQSWKSKSNIGRNLDYIVPSITPIKDQSASIEEYFELHPEFYSYCQNNIQKYFKSHDMFFKQNVSLLQNLKLLNYLVLFGHSLNLNEVIQDSKNNSNTEINNKHVIYLVLIPLEINNLDFESNYAFRLEDYSSLGFKQMSNNPINKAFGITPIKTLKEVILFECIEPKIY